MKLPGSLTKKEKEKKERRREESTTDERKAILVERNETCLVFVFRSYIYILDDRRSRRKRIAILSF